MKLVLGTVQFGLDYGIANQTGQVPLDEARQILQLAARHGLNTLDTAIAYGTSEATLGQIGVADWQIVSKLPAIPADCPDVAQWVTNQVEGSLQRLQVDALYAVLLHRPDQLFTPFGQPLLQVLAHLQQRKLIRKIGVSIYTPDELPALLNVMPIDMVQTPLNILDQRLITSGWAQRLQEQRVELHVRSVFLQGLLLLPPERLPQKFAPYQAVWSEWTRWLQATNLTPLEACLRYVLGNANIDKVVVGVDGCSQLADILAISALPLPSLPDWPLPMDPVLLNPASWNTL